MKTKVNRDKLTSKEKEFARVYAKGNDKQKLNGTQSALTVYNTDDPKSASVIGAKNLAKVRVKREIDKHMDKIGLDDELVSGIHHRNITQEQNLPVSQQAVRDYYKVKGIIDSNKDDNSVVNVAFVINK